MTMVLRSNIHLVNCRKLKRCVGQTCIGLQFIRIGTIYEDVTPDVLGSIGIWQWLVVLASTAFTAASMVNQYEDMFLLKPPIEVTCIPPERDVLNASLCTVTSTNNATEELECKKWHVKLFWLIWLKKSWLVFCEDEMKLLSTTMISRMGLMFGCVIFGLIADSYGRRTAVAVDLFAQLGLGIFITFCDSEAWFQLLVFLKALFGAATLYLGLVTTCEISSNGWRSRLSAIVSIPRFLSSMCSVPLANAFPNMETYNFTTTIFIILLIILLRWTPESPQWLLFNRKIPDAEKCLYIAAKRNAINICDDFRIRPVNNRAYSCLDETRTCTGIFYSYNVKIILATSFLFWSLTSFKLGYLRAKVFGQLRTEQYLSVLITSAVGIAGLTTLLSRKILLRYLLLSNILLSVLTTSGEVLLGHFQIAPHIFTAVALGSEVVVHLLLLNITPRLFAINIRATLFGCCHAIGQLGTMVSYLLLVFQPLDDIAAIGLEIGLTMVLVCLCLVLIDVDERELPDTIVDMDYFSELSKPLRWATQKTNSPSHEEVEMRIHSFGSAGREVSQNRSEDRIPARRIGCFNFWRRFVANLRNTLSKS